MKPRLKSADLTLEDLYIWGDRWGGYRTRECTSLASISKYSDWCDADLMLMAQQRIGSGSMLCENVDGDGFIDTNGAQLGSYGSWAENDVMILREDLKW
jgi:hypothetical protein